LIIGKHYNEPSLRRWLNDWRWSAEIGNFSLKQQLNLVTMKENAEKEKKRTR
jgi:hypothetical protein